MSGSSFATVWASPYILIALGVSFIISKNGVEIVFRACAELVAAVADAVVEAVVVVLVMGHVLEQKLIIMN